MAQSPIRFCTLTYPHPKESVGISRQVIESFASKVKTEAECWLWTGSITRVGYGQFAIKHGRNVSAHRFAWFLKHGSAPRRPLGVLHRCDVRACVNPDHLWLGTQSDNLSDAALKGRLRRAVA